MLAVCEAVPNVLRYVLFGTLCCANVLVNSVLYECAVPNVLRCVLLGTFGAESALADVVGVNCA